MEKTPSFSKSQLKHELNVFFNHDMAMLDEWLDTPIPRLNGQSPRGFLVTKEKRSVLFEVLQEMKFGDIA